VPIKAILILVTSFFKKKKANRQIEFIFEVCEIVVESVALVVSLIEKPESTEFLAEPKILFLRFQ